MRERWQAATWALVTCCATAAVAGCGDDASAEPAAPAGLPAVVMSPTLLPTPSRPSPKPPRGVRTAPPGTPGPGYLNTLTARQAQDLQSMPWHQLAPLARGQGLEASVDGLGGCVSLRGARLTTEDGATEVAFLATRPERGEACTGEAAIALVRVRIPGSAFATRIVHAPVDADR